MHGPMRVAGPAIGIWLHKDIFMRNVMLLSAALVGFASTGFAQTAGTPPAAPAATPPASTPAETLAAPTTPKPRPHHARASSADSEIRPGHEPGVGDSFPASDKASNVTAADSRSRIAPRLPAPAGGENAAIGTLLTEAQHAVDTRQTGRAQEALERAETAMLQRSVQVDQATTPDQAPDVMQVEAARKALAGGDLATAKKSIAAAMSAGK